MDEIQWSYTIARFTVRFTQILFMIRPCFHEHATGGHDTINAAWKHSLCSCCGRFWLMLFDLAQSYCQSAQAAFAKVLQCFWCSAAAATFVEKQMASLWERTHHNMYENTFGELLEIPMLYSPDIVLADRGPSILSVHQKWQRSSGTQRAANDNELLTYCHCTWLPVDDFVDVKVITVIYPHQ